MMPPTERLSDSAAGLLRLLISGEHLSRPELSTMLQVTSPTVGTALTELINGGFVTQTGVRQGKLGRAAGLYGLDVRSGWLLGIDMGSTQILIVARSLDGALLSDFRYAAAEAAQTAGPAPSLVSVAFERVAQLLVELTASYGQLRAVGMALAHVVPNSSSTDSMIGLADGAVRLDDILNDIGLPAGVPVLIENNVNCAALAELSLGAARSAESFVYLQIGVHLGAALFLDGKLRRGSHGGAGELSRLPFPMVPESPGVDRTFLLEKHLGSEQLLARTRSHWRGANSGPPTSSKQLLDLASRGVDGALDAVGGYADDIAGVAMLLGAVVDPELIVLGGGVGQNQLLGGMVEERLQAEYPEIRLAVSALGDRATVEGATALATEYARSSLLGIHYTTILSTNEPIGAVLIAR